MHRRLLFMMFAATFCTASISHAQASGTVTLNATLAEQLSISASPSNVNFTLNAGAAADGSAPVVINTSWVMLSTRNSVKLFAWFTTPSAALTDGGSTPNNIGSSLVLGKVTTGTPTGFTAFTQTNTLGPAAGGLLLFTQSLSTSNRNSSRTDNLLLQIDLSSLPQLPAGSYSGTLNLQAQAF